MPPNPPAGTPVYTPLRATDVRPYDAEEALKAQLPLFDNPKKTDYLGYRAVGFSIRESCALVGNLGQRQVNRWRREDSSFAMWEGDRLPELTSRISSILLNANFTRNMMLVLHVDGKILSKAAYGPEGLGGLSADENKYLLKAADRYKTQELLAMARALQPERDDGAGGMGTSINVYVGGEHIHGIEAERAAAQQLLSKFTKNITIIDAVEGIEPDDDTDDSN